MLTHEELDRIVNNITAPGVEVRLHCGPGEGHYLQVHCTRPDAVTGEIAEGSGGKYYVSLFSTESEVVQKALGAVLAYHEHEVRETFHYEGVALFNPHIDVRAHMEIAGRQSVRSPA